MGKSNTIRKILFVICLIVAASLGSDVIVTIKDQRRIAKTNCYLNYNDNTFCVNLVYKSFPYGTKKDVLIEKNILRAYWNENKDILAIDYAHSGDITGYYLLIKTDTKELFSPYEPYTIKHFSTISLLKQYLEYHNIVFHNDTYCDWRE